jgi:ubiquinone/menaquinone biosynthesis C-methylase UbiE
LSLGRFGAGRRLDRLDFGCGTGALPEAIVATEDPTSLIGIDPSEGFLGTARSRVSDPRAAFLKGGAEALDLHDASRDTICAGHVLNVVPDRAAMLAEIHRVGRPGARVGLYVSDYPDEMGFLRAFWTAATALDPTAEALTEVRRFAADGSIPLTARAWALGARI